VTRLRILIADDHTLVRQGLRKIIEARPEWEVVAEAGTGREAVQQTIDLQPDVVIMDVAMPHLNGVEAVQQIHRRAPHVRVLMLSMYADEAYVTRAVRAGAAGYLLKDSADADLIGAVQALSQGKSFFSPSVAKVLVDEYVRHLSERGITDRYDALSEREREVFQLVVEGYSSKEVASLLQISPATVETHRAHVMEKLGVHTTAELVLYAVRKGVIR
jgi:two-component system, NarL family, response regulator NreC